MQLRSFHPKPIRPQSKNQMTRHDALPQMELPLIRWEQEEVMILTIESYQFHRTPERMMRLLEYFFVQGIQAMIQSTSVDGVTFYLPLNSINQATRGRLVESIEQLLPGDCVEVIPSALYVRAYFLKRTLSDQIKALWLTDLAAKHLTPLFVAQASHAKQVDVLVLLEDVLAVQRSLEAVLISEKEKQSVYSA